MGGLPDLDLRLGMVGVLKRILSRRGDDLVGACGPTAAYSPTPPYERSTGEAESLGSGDRDRWNRLGGISASIGGAAVFCVDVGYMYPGSIW